MPNGAEITNDLNWDALAALATLAGSIGLIIGLAIAVWQLFLTARAEKAQAKAAESQHLMDVLRKWDDRPLEEARREVNRYEDSNQLLEALRKSGEEPSDEYFILLRVPGFFEDLGVLVFDLGVVKIESVRHSLAAPVKHYRQRFEPFVSARREIQEKQQEEPTAYEWFEKLAQEI